MKKQQPNQETIFFFTMTWQIIKNRKLIIYLRWSCNPILLEFGQIKDKELDFSYVSFQDFWNNVTLKIIADNQIE